MLFRVLMSTNPQPELGWSFKCFLIGTAIGALFGLLTTELWGLFGPYRAQISAGFWGLLGGILGLAIGIAYYFINRRQTK
jgi:hypothetical protein